MSVNAERAKVGEDCARPKLAGYLGAKMFMSCMNDAKSPVFCKKDISHNDAEPHSVFRLFTPALNWALSVHFTNPLFSMTVVNIFANEIIASAYFCYHQHHFVIS